jgi:hypothetical protein
MRFRKAALLAAGLAVCLSGGASAQGVTVSGTGLTTTITATVAPKRLPKRGGVPVKLIVVGHRSTDTQSGSNPDVLEGIELLLDRQLSIDTKGLASCPTVKLSGVEPSVARKRCGRALIGRGQLVETYKLAEQPPTIFRHTILFFNAGGAVVAYETTVAASAPSHHFPASATLIGNARRLKVPIGLVDTSEASFRFIFDRTWRQRKSKHSYLSARCQTGTIKSRFRLKIRLHGNVPSNVTRAASQRCIAH